MRDRYFVVVATIAASVLTACSDAAVDQITAPPSAATPVQPVASQWPTADEIAAAEVPSAIGIQIQGNSYFAPDTLSFVVEARVRFQWANDVSVTVWASVIDRNGSVINSSEASMAYQRFAVPVASSDTTFVIRVATNGIKCGLTGKSAYAGRAAVNAIDARLVVITLWKQELGRTNWSDVEMRACSPQEVECEPVSRLIGGTSAALPSTAGCLDDTAPAPPNGSDTLEVCFTIWREVWVLDLETGQSTFLFEFPLGTYCYVPED